MEAALAPEVGAGYAPVKMAASGVALLLRQMGRLVASSRALSFISMFFILAFLFFCFR